jgi:hypothetical protein
MGRHKVFGRIYSDPADLANPYWFRQNTRGGGQYAGARSLLGALGYYLTDWGWAAGRQNLPRWMQHFTAIWCGFFWITCEHCTKGWGGQQWNLHPAQDVLISAESSRAAYCPACAHTRDTWDSGWAERQSHPRQDSRQAS